MIWYSAVPQNLSRHPWYHVSNHETHNAAVGFSILPPVSCLLSPVSCLILCRALVWRGAVRCGAVRICAVPVSSSLHVHAVAEAFFETVRAPRLSVTSASESRKREAGAACNKVGCPLLSKLRWDLRVASGADLGEETPQTEGCSLGYPTVQQVKQE